jgi:hypothetical protein
VKTSGDRLKRVAWSVGKFLNSLSTGSFSGRAELHGFSYDLLIYCMVKMQGDTFKSET